MMGISSDWILEDIPSFQKKGKCKEVMTACEYDFCDR